eukprot:403362715
MGCNCSKSNDSASLDRPQTSNKKKAIKIYGSYLNSDTLTILAILTKLNLPHTFINIFEKKHGQLIVNTQYERMMEIKDNSQNYDLPIISIDKGLSIYPKNMMIMIYLINSNSHIRNEFVPGKVEKEMFIEQMVKYGTTKLRKLSLDFQKQIIIKTMPSALVETQNLSTQATESQFNDELRATSNQSIFDDIRQSLQEFQSSDFINLNESQILNINSTISHYLPSTYPEEINQEITILDLIIYYDLKMLIKLTQSEAILSEFTQVTNWYIKHQNLADSKELQYYFQLHFDELSKKLI